MNYSNSPQPSEKENFDLLELRKRLQKKFEQKDYHIRNQGFEKLARFTSYTFNIFSVLTAATAVYFFVVQMLQNMILTIGITMVFMAILEIAKRTTGSSFIKNYLVNKEFPLPQFSLLVGLIVLSIFFSYSGSKKAIKEFRASPELRKAKDYTTSYREDIAKINKEIADARETTYKGTTTSKSQATIIKLTDDRSKLQDKIFKIEEQVQASNEATLAEYNGSTDNQAYYFAMATILCELLFLLSLYYMELYDYRSYTELFSSPKPTTEGKQTIDLDKKIAQLVESNIQQKLAQAKQQLAKENQQKKLPKPNTIQNPVTAEAVTTTVQVPSKKSYAKHTLSEEQLTELTTIDTAIKAAKKKIRLANFRLKKGEGKTSTHLKNIETAEKEIEDLITKRNAIETESDFETKLIS